MKNTTLLALTFFTATAAFADVTVVPGNACNAVLPGQSQQLEWRQNGLINPTTNKDFFVVCPMERISSSTDSGAFTYWGGAIIASASADAAETSSVSCQMREMVGDTRVASRSASVTLAPGETGVMTWSPRRVRDDSLSSYHASCRMPPQTQVNTAISVSAIDGDASQLNAVIERIGNN
ncbi:MAG: hypothetical protein Cons2KO_30060 [Congregibacter sp.]